MTAFNTSERVSFVRQVIRACLLRCPRCAEGRLFRNFLRMNERCPACKLDFQRDPGFYLGAIYFNYGLTAVLVTATYVGLSLLTEVSKEIKLVIALVPAVLFPFLFFRFSRSLWLGFDYFVDRTARE